MNPDHLRARLRADLDELVGRRADELAAIDAALAPLITSLLAATRGGKLLRPTFCFWGFVGAGGSPDDDRILRAGTAFELLHSSALVHDDLIDRSPVRRGEPTVHRQFERFHTEYAWRGSASDFGTASALLLGDLLLGWATDALAESGFAADAVNDGLGVFASARTEMIAGQYLDMAHQAAGAATVEEALRVARLKSARYTTERPLQLGCALAGGGSALMEVYAAFGEPLGEAFQLCDDLAGVFGDPRVTGKPAGDDIREGKRTVLLALAYERATAGGRALLDATVGDATADDTSIQAVRDVIDASGAGARIAELVNERVAAAIDAIGGIPHVAREALEQLAYDVTSFNRRQDDESAEPSGASRR